jgi:hypothetical protein
MNNILITIFFKQKMNPKEAFKYRDSYRKETTTNIRISRDRSISILMDLNGDKHESFKFLGENRFAVSGGVSHKIYACLECKGDHVKAIENQLKDLMENDREPEFDMYADEA